MFDPFQPRYASELSMRTLNPDEAIASTAQSIDKYIGRRNVPGFICWYGLQPLFVPWRLPVFVYER